LTLSATLWRCAGQANTLSTPGTNKPLARTQR
jgi:hypothetical protein